MRRLLGIVAAFCCVTPAGAQVVIESSRWGFDGKAAAAAARCCCRPGVR